MIYIDKEDLISKAFERAIDESSKDFDKAIEQSELEQIEIIKSYLSKYYNVEEIFNPQKPVISIHLKRILSYLVLEDIFSRNAYRKYSQNSYVAKKIDEAKQELKDISKGIITLDNLPEKQEKQGKNSKILYGNLSNRNFYI